MAWKRRTGFLAVASFLIVAGPLATGASGSSTPAAPETGFESEHAANFRRDLGFEASPSTVARSVWDRAQFPDLTYGVPLTSQEANEVRRRNYLASAASDALQEAAKDRGWGGAWIDHSAGGTLVLQYTGDASRREADLSHLLPDGEIRFQSVQFSVSDLQGVVESILSDRKLLELANVTITAAGVDVDRNRVRVGVRDLSKGATAELVARYGDAIYVEQVDYGTPDACPETNCLPIRAGLGFEDPVGGDYAPCTVGYLALRRDTSPDTLVALTAGHCIRYGEKGTWHHGGEPIGAPFKTGSAAAYTHTFFDNSNADVGLIRTNLLAPSDRRYRNELLINEQGSYLRITRYEPWVSQAEDLVVCRMGRTTNQVCGPITIRNDNRLSEIPGEPPNLIKGVVVYRADALSGDSGGPVYLRVQSCQTCEATATMYGTHIHSDSGAWSASKFGWYSPVDRGQITIEDRYPGLDIAMCTTSLCGLPDPITGDD